MNRKYNLKLDLQFRCNNSIMKFNQFDNNTSDFFMRITNGGNLVDVEKAIVVLAAIKPSGKVASQFVEVKNGLVYVDLKPNMKDEIGTYTAQAMLILEDERVVTDSISYEVEEDKIFSLLNDTVEDTEDFTLLTDMLNRLSTIEISEEQRIINEAERILSEENRKIEEAKRVEAELIRQHEEADRAKYDATRESNENIRKQNESIRLANETNRIDEEANRVEAEQLRKDNYNFMIEDEDRRRSEANAHKEAEKLRAQAENTRVNEEAKRRTTEQARVLAENTRVSNENTRKANETTRQSNETKRVEAETQRQNRYNSFISDAEANANNFENYTNTAKAKEEERKANELDRKSQEDRRISNEVERISNENTRKANELDREENEASRQNVFENKVSEVDEKISEINTTKDNFISSINTKVDNKISELDNAKTDMSNTVSNKIDEVENRFNALTSKQQQDAEVIDARDGEVSLKARLDRDIEKAKQVYAPIEGNYISTDSSSGYAKDVEILGNTVQDASNLAEIRSVGDTVEGQELYEIPVLSRGKNLFNSELEYGFISDSDGSNGTYSDKCIRAINYTKVKPNTTYSFKYAGGAMDKIYFYDKFKKFISLEIVYGNGKTVTTPSNCEYIRLRFYYSSGISMEEIVDVQIEEGTQATPYEPYQEDKLTILSPTPLEKVGDVADRIIEKDGVWGVEKNVVDMLFNEANCTITMSSASDIHPNYAVFDFSVVDNKSYVKTSLLFCDKFNHLLYSADRNSSDKEGCWIGNAVFFTVKILKSKLESVDVNGMKKWLKTNNLNLKYLTTKPQFIPLPHDQQIKLRTFANKTNISFLTEIEGTIKAQVPKSLGATVNTHTEQISNLNKELDRVKKLEESTVSTVETESDFTTVEATSNGYFEDVKLEGKTLVNLFRFKDYKIINEVNLYAVCSDTKDNNITSNRTFTFRNTTSRQLTLDINENGTWKRSVLLKANEQAMVTTTPTEYVSYIYGTGSSGWEVNSESHKQELKNACILLEGDHTQNPPSYFEGLKSVGQSATTSEDGADEIVVSSVNENLFDDSVLSFKLGASVRTDFIPFKLKHKEIGYMAFNEDLSPYTNSNFAFRLCDKSKKEIQWFNFSANETSMLGKTCEHFKEVEYIQFFTNGNMTDTHTISNFVITKDNTKIYKTYIPHQLDKKRLLYYNEETQSWEKPILRQWDSIEKHSDGKYYYHQRSGEVVLNGSEGWAANDGFSTGDYIACMTHVALPGKKYGVLNMISDKFKTKNCALLPVVEEGIWGELGNSVVYVSVSKSKLSSQDAQGFIGWLQANNVTVVYQLAQEKVYECTNIDLITYANETNYIVESGAIAPKTTLKVHNNISNVVSLLQKKVSLLENNITSYMITQNRLMLASRYNADTVSFKVDVATLRNSFEYDNDLYELILNNILVGKDNYNREYIENLIIFYWMDFVISDEMHSTLFEIIEEQHNPKIEEEAPLI